ncbi:MAG: acyl-CoA dehydratase activase [Candidatus Heimdallarchaeaceae archaeon]
MTSIESMNGTIFIGVNIGSVSVNVVACDENGNLWLRKEAHSGKPAETLDKILAEVYNNPNVVAYYSVAGSFGEISEIAAIEAGVRALGEEYDLIISLGGESFVLYVLNGKGDIVNILSHDKCAAGSGEFFIQQIDRLNIPLEEAIELAKKGDKIRLASRCSVHCKSDITHKLNKGEASIEDILTSVIYSMVNKVLALIYQSRTQPKRILVIGGVTLNTTFVDMLREHLSETEVIIKEVSPVFEAFGAAQIAKEEPIYTSPRLKTSRTFTSLPPLEDFADYVTIIEPQPYKKDFDPDGKYILGVDVGSTTTKAVVVDPEDLSILASFYGRTSGNPVRAAQECIKEIIKQIGNVKINLIGVTGSGRQIVGAYLGTNSIFNEISAHSEGAVFFDSEVDTIFEIGGQDSKYMYLENGVPVDYAMNASCSAGTGSFLEESAKGDLGITVYEIADIALKAPNPVRFKADCAAFINTDIRTALQEGYHREDIIGGLVYSIATNYLNKVKGSRRVGKKVFFQGGVAKNKAVGYAFAQATGKHIVIPPYPELIGAFGIALISKAKFENNEVEPMPADTHLEDLIKSELKHVGSFICKACKNYCQIEQYQVAGRKFAFGGRCSRYENIRMGKKALEKENLVDIRTELIFGKEEKPPKHSKGTVGIPRALLTHTLFPLFSTFFKELGYEVVLSDIDPAMEFIANAPFCYPTQILHGAVLDLIKKGVDWIFLPHVNALPKGEKWLDATFCPISQAGPYFIGTAFDNTKMLRPVLNFREGYEEDYALVEMAVKQLNQRRKIADHAFRKAIEKQKEVERQFIELGKKTLEELEKTNETAIVLVGRSYNAFPPETSQLVPKKLASMGVSVIPFDFLEKTPVYDIPWYFGNYVKVALDLVNKKDNLFLLYISSYSCTTDTFIQNYVRSEMKTKPYLLLELDAHTGDAGTQTRLEAFLEIIKNYRREIKHEEEPFVVSKVKRRNGKVVVFTSDGRKLDIKDPKVKLYFPPFSKYHIEAVSRVFNLFGFNVGESSDIKMEYPIKGLQYCTGKECIPLPIVLGHLLSIVDQRKSEDEVIGYYMIRGGSPCVVYSYYHYIEQFIKDNKLKNVFIFRFDQFTDFLGVNRLTVVRYGPKMLLLGDLMYEIENALKVVGEKNSITLLHKYWHEFLESLRSLKDFDKKINELIDKIATIPRRDSPKNYPKVLVTGDFFVRFSSFFLEELKDIYAKHGIIVKSTDVFELLMYGSYNLQHTIAQFWKTEPYSLKTTLRAITRPWTRDSQLYIMSKLTPAILHFIEIRLRKRFEKTGLLFAEPNNLKAVFKYSKDLISPLIFGEAIPAVGKGMEALNSSIYDCLVLTGPLYCLPYKISQAVLKPIYLERNMPFLVFDVDISAITPNMKRMIHANIEQIKRRRALLGKN